MTDQTTGQPAAPPAYLSRSYVSLQTRFAERMAEVSGLPLSETLLRFTNFHRRMGFGTPATAVPPPAWRAMIDGALKRDHDDRVDHILETMRPYGDGAAVLLAGRVQFGCFACEPPDAEGMVRIHFGNRVANADVGPLHSSRIEERRAELRAMFAWLAREHPSARRVDGGSWLYNLEAYRRLFPAEFAASRSPRNGPPYLHGMSIWGQFMDFRARIRPDVRDAFLVALPNLKADAPHLVFPYQALFTTAPFASFRREYGV